MTDLIVLAFANEADAIRMRDKLFELKQEQRLNPLADAVFVVRKPAGKMTVKHEVRLVGTSAYQGLLLDFVFWMFYQEMAASAVANTPNNPQGYIGLDDKFVMEISRVMELSHGALFLLADKFSEDKVKDLLQDFNGTILRKSLSKEDEAMLMAVFGR
ncbi:MAG TPA: DUF1269 domain-containing protein [Anaerolineae bacterium]|nr:DUF1269 domain-containing protein [Anaerolineae bacterium]